MLLFSFIYSKSGSDKTAPPPNIDGDEPCTD
jgi:hypothetical protein